jgi:hypothetical protein
MSKLNPEYINFTRFELQQHVKQALREAWKLSEDKPIDAGCLLKGVMITKQRITSEAFNELAALLSDKKGKYAQVEVSALLDRSDFDLSAVPVTAALRRSFTIAAPFFEREKAVWGRDYITFALLTADDPSLERLANNADTTLSAVRDEWYRFVTSDTSHLSPQVWQEWWRTAGVPIPQLPSRRKKRGKDVKEAEISPPPEGDSSPVLAEDSAPCAWVETDCVPSSVSQDYRPSEHDSLDVKQQAETFAALLIAQEISPPFALGLLGDWGVGKTFFMRLMQEKIEATAGKRVLPRDYSGSVSRAAQIEFNAWHYVDSDLWASLATRIFDRLAEELRGERESRTSG